MEGPYTLWYTMVEVNNEKFRAEFEPIKKQAIKNTINKIKGKLR